MEQKSRHEQQIVPKSSPIGQGFLGSRMVLKGLENGLIKKRPKRSGPIVVRKTKNMEKQIKKETLSPSQNKNRKKIPQIKKMEKKFLSSPLPDPKIKKQIHNKIKKLKTNAERKKI